MTSDRRNQPSGLPERGIAVEPLIAAKPGNGHLQLAQSFEVTIRCYSDQQLVLHALVDLEFRVSLEVFPHGGLGIVTRTPRALAKHLGRHVFDDRVEGHAVAAHGGERRIGFQLSQHVLMGVVAVQAHQHALPAHCFGLDLSDHIGCDAGALDHRDSLRHGVRVDRLAVVGADVNINSQHSRVLRAPAGSIQLEHGGGEDQ